MLWRCLMRVVILPQQPSDREACAPEVLREEIEVVDALPVYAHHLQLHRPESHPCQTLVATNLSRVELKDAVVLGLQPCSCDVDVLEIHVPTLRAQALHLCFNAKQDV